MSGPQQNDGIISNKDGNPDVRPLLEGGSEAWTFIRWARERAWERAGLDPSVLRCPENADDIHFDGFPGRFADDIALPSDFINDDMGPQDWLFLGDAPDAPFEDFVMELEH